LSPEPLIFEPLPFAAIHNPCMHLISGRERHRRMREGLVDAWARVEHSAQDPGLRDSYDSLPRAPIRMLVGALNKDINQGGLLRLSDAFRIERIEFTPEPDGAIDMAGSRGTKKRQPWMWRDVGDAVTAAKVDGYRTVAISLSDRAIPFDEMAWDFPLALVLGAELEGLDPEVEARCDATVGIPLYGIVQSLNVACAAGIVLQHAVRAYARQITDFVPARRASRTLLGMPSEE
jgi:23S rRNA (guanosine2251-2'-O)-methyltransferase